MLHQAEGAHVAEHASHHARHCGHSLEDDRAMAIPLREDQIRRNAQCLKLKSALLHRKEAERRKETRPKDRKREREREEKNSRHALTIAKAIASIVVVTLRCHQSL
jgi:hypothetical protein